MIRLLGCVFFITLSISLKAQNKLTISREEAEAIFLQNNLSLISEKLNIETQKAELIQSKLWPNPQFSFNQFNFWATPKQTGGQEVVPPLWNNFGKNQQFAFDIQQLIQTAGKRKKLIALEQVEVSKAEQYFEEVLRGLKLELRTQLTELQYLQQAIHIHQNLIQHINQLSNAYKTQLDKGYISKVQYTRLKAQELEINNALFNFQNDYNQAQQNLKLLLRINPATSIEISDSLVCKPNIQWNTATAKLHRPDYKLAEIEEDFAQKQWLYEKAKSTPDLTLGMNYDRNGSTMLNFVGFGVSFDLPVFNRNKGGIQKAQIGIEKARVLKEYTLSKIDNEIYLAQTSLQQALDFKKSINSHYEQELDQLLELNTQHLIAKNISMVEYLDFLSAYLDNKKIILEAQKNVCLKSEELNYTLGKN